MNKLAVKINPQFSNLKDLPPNSFILGFKDNCETEIIIAHDCGEVPFEINHRHFGEYIENLKSYVLESFFENCKDYSSSIDIDNPRVSFELITDAKGKITYFSH